MSSHITEQDQPVDPVTLEVSVNILAVFEVELHAMQHPILGSLQIASQIACINRVFLY